MVVEPVCVTDNGKSQTIKAQYANSSIANFCCYTSTYGASGVAEPVETTKEGKSYAMTAGYANGSGENIGNYVVHTLKKGCKTMVSEPVFNAKQVGALPRPNGELSTSQAFRIYDIDAKSVTLKAGGGGAGGKTGLYAIPIEYENNEPIKAVSVSDNKTYTVYKVQDGRIEIKGKTYSIKLADGYYIIRKLTVDECKKLQTVPNWFEFPISNAQAYKCLGNGWTVDVIVHLLEATMK